MPLLEVSRDGELVIFSLAHKDVFFTLKAEVFLCPAEIIAISLSLPAPQLHQGNPRSLWPVFWSIVFNILLEGK